MTGWKKIIVDPFAERLSGHVRFSSSETVLANPFRCCVIETLVVIHTMPLIFAVHAHGEFSLVKLELIPVLADSFLIEANHRPNFRSSIHDIQSHPVLEGLHQNHTKHLPLVESQ